MFLLMEASDTDSGGTMRTFLIAAGAALAFSLAAAPHAADAKGCMKGTAVGGVGHMAGHGVAGAAADCAVGHHHAKKKEEAQQTTATHNNAASGSTTDKNGSA